MDFGSIILIVIGVILFLVLAPYLGIVFIGFSGVASFFILCVIIGTFILELIAPILQAIGNFIGGGLGFIFKIFLWLVIISIVCSIVSFIYSFFAPKKNKTENLVEDGNEVEDEDKDEITNPNDVEKEGEHNINELDSSICKKCGAKLDDGDAFCGNCGNKVGE